MKEKTQNKILVTGADGQLGMAFRHHALLYKHVEFEFVSKYDFDITLQSREMLNLRAKKPQVVINCAAYTNVEKAESEPEAAMQVNAHAAGYLAEACHENEIILVHFSTDYVFDGTKKSPYLESDAVNPLSVYGKSKLEGERLIDEKMERYYIFRTSWLYSEYGNNFFKTMLRLAKENGKLDVVSDQVSSPTYAGHLAFDVLLWLEKLLIEKVDLDCGIYHYSSSGEASWFDFANAIMKDSHVEVPVTPLLTTDTKYKAVRPAYSKLDSTKFHSQSKITARHWHDGLKECTQNFQNRHGNGSI